LCIVCFSCPGLNEFATSADREVQLQRNEIFGMWEFASLVKK
jgi:hypothetical protein